MSFYTNRRVFSVDGCHVLIIHNVITGSKRVYVNDILSKEIPHHLFECLNRIPINVNGSKYEIVVSPRWYGTFNYDIMSRDHGYGLIDEAFL